MKLKSLIKYVLHPGKLKNTLDYKIKIFFLKRKLHSLKSDCNKLLILNTPLHSNLGDQAIICSEIEFIRRKFNKEIIEVPNVFIQDKSIYEHLVSDQDVVFVHGGGYLGTIWPFEEENFRFILKTFSDKKIIVFPQTVFFDLESSEGKAEYAISKMAYEGCKNLYICTREENSYNFMRDYFSGVKVLLTPDIVMSLKLSDFNLCRKNILLCFRNDKEKYIKNDSYYNILRILEAVNLPIKYSDTVIDRNIFPLERKNTLMKKWKEFASAKIVITDRLHGVIFSLITNTPCVAFDNSSHKVSGLYNSWLKEIKTIRLVNDSSMLLTAVRELLGYPNYCYDNNLFSDRWEELEKLIKENIGNE